MARNRFIKPEVERLLISDGDWVEIKKQLNIAEQKRLETAGMNAKVVDGRLFNVVDWATHDLERAAIFLVDWSLRDAEDRPVPYNYDALKSLDIETFEEINKAIVDFVLKQNELKKAQREMIKTQTLPGA